MSSFGSHTLSQMGIIFDMGYLIESGRRFFPTASRRVKRKRLRNLGVQVPYARVRAVSVGFES